MLFACFAALGMASGMDLYVDPVNGDDSNDGFSWETAVKTITRASSASHIHLAEGTFSEASGEVFPILLTHRDFLLSGQGYEKTIIDAGGSAEVIIIKHPSDYDGTHITASGLSFIRSSPLEIDRSDRGAIVLLPWGGADLDHVRFMNLSGAPIITGMENSSSFTACIFQADSPDDICDGYPGIVVFDQCTFDYSPSPPIYLGADLVSCEAWLEIKNCQFTSHSNRATINASSSGFAYCVNCSFENIDFNIRKGGESSRGPEIFGCSFRSSRLGFLIWIIGWMGGSPGDATIRKCVFDSNCTLDIEAGYVRIMESCSPFHPYNDLNDDADLFICASTIRENPLFAHGPLGGCYLSNVKSGQRLTSPCVGLLPESGTPDWADWPPSGSTTRTDGVPDEAPFDIGYHYPSVPPPPPSVSIRTDRSEYAPGDEMILLGSFENRGVLVEGGIYVAFGPESLDWLLYWPSMTFVRAPVFEGKIYSGAVYPMCPLDALIVPQSLAPGGYLWLGAVLNADGVFASDIALWPVTITAD